MSDPTQLGSLPHDITMYAHVIPADLCPTIEQSGDWNLYVDSVQPSTKQSNTLGWWEGMCERVPLLYKCARRMLAIPHMSCDMERSFSMWKRVHSEKQHSMQHGTHKRYVSFCFNGVVLAPEQMTKGVAAGLAFDIHECFL